MNDFIWLVQTHFGFEQSYQMSRKHVMSQASAQTGINIYTTYKQVHLKTKTNIMVVLENHY